MAYEEQLHEQSIEGPVMNPTARGLSCQHAFHMALCHRVWSLFGDPDRENRMHHHKSHLPAPHCFCCARQAGMLQLSSGCCCAVYRADSQAACPGRESHLQHLIGLIEHQQVGVAGGQGALGHPPLHPAMCPHYHLLRDPCLPACSHQGNPDG